MKNKLSISLLCMPNLRKIDFFFKTLIQEKIYNIELPISKISKDFSNNKKKLKAFKLKMEKYSINVSSVQSIFYNKERWNIFDLKKHKVILNHLHKVFKISKYFRAKNIIFGSPKNRYLDKYSDKKNSIIFFNKVAKIANNFDINFCIEPNSKYYNCNYINNTSDAIKLVKLINNKNILINADTGNIFLEKDKCAEVYKNYKLFGNFQISEKNLVSLSDGNINHLKILKKFKIKKNFISLEMLNIDHSTLKKNITKFKGIISKYGTNDF